MGSTGSIGTSTLDLLRQHPDLARVELLSAHRNIKCLLEQIEEFHPKKAFLTGCAPETQDVERAKQEGCELIAEPSELLRAMSSSSTNCVILAIIGAAGLEYGLEALKYGKRLAIANKEPLVIAGHLFNEVQASGDGEIIPIDSEHSAIFQCLEGQKGKNIERIILTSSGGPFHNSKESEFSEISVEEALRHPTWSMGDKITIDSATMMNKALEVIEAKWLFACPVTQIDVVIHRQSIVHSMVEFIDGSVMAQLGMTDMKHPIQYALSYPERHPSLLPRLDWSQHQQWTFEPINPFLERSIQLARECSSDDVSPVLMNAANECFVDAFMNGRLPFNKVYKVIEQTIEKGLGENFKADTLEDIKHIDQFARNICKEIVGSL